MDLQARLDFAVAAAREAGRLVMSHWRRDDLAVELKADASPVTIADRGAEELLRERLAKAFPQDGVLGEEFGERPGANDLRWVLDPIDGTKSFVHGVPLFGVMLGLEKLGHGAIVGVVHFPALGETVFAAQGAGCWHTRAEEPPRAAKVSSCDRIEQALLCTSALDGFRDDPKWNRFLSLSKATRLSRTWGDCYGYAMVATGRAEIMIDPKMNLWDNAALQPIIEEAGGQFTDWRGEATIYHPEALATNGRLHAAALALVQ